MNQVWNIARKEFSDGLRNRWLLAITLAWLAVLPTARLVVYGWRDRG